MGSWFYLCFDNHFFAVTCLFIGLIAVGDALNHRFEFDRTVAFGYDYVIERIPCKSHLL